MVLVSSLRNSRLALHHRLEARARLCKTFSIKAHRKGFGHQHGPEQARKSFSSGHDVLRENRDPFYEAMTFWGHTGIRRGTIRKVEYVTNTDFGMGKRRQASICRGYFGEGEEDL